MSNEQISKMEKGYYVKWAICIVVPIIIMLFPTNEIFTPLIRRYLAVTSFGILLFLFELMHAPLVAMCLAISYPVLGVCELSVALQSWSHSIVYQAFCCMLILEAVNNTPLLQRFAAALIIRVGGSYLGILMGMAILGLVAAIAIPSVFTTILVAGIGYGLCMALGLKKGDNAAVGIMLMAALGVCEAQNFLYSPQGIGATTAMVATAIDGFQIGYVEIIKDNLIFVPFLFLLPVLFSKLFKADNINGIDYFKQQLKDLGAISKKEKIVIAILVVMVVYLFTSQWHGMEMTFGYVGATLLLYLPPFGIADKRTFSRVDLSLPLLVASCMAIGNVGTDVGAGAALSSIIIPLLQGVDSSIVFVIAAWISGVLSNMLMTPMALYTVLCPVLGPIADALHYSAKIVAYVIYHCGNQVFFPYENNTILVVYGMGLMKMGQFIKGATAKMVLDLLYILILAVPYWMLIGLL